MKKVICFLVAAIAITQFVSCTKEEGGGRIKSISFQQNSYSIFAGQQIIPDMIVLPENADRSSIEWTSNNPSVATVSGGYVTGVSEGDATITAKRGKASASIYVHVQWVDVVSCNVPSRLEIGIGASVKVRLTDFQPLHGNLANLKPVIQDGPANGSGTVQAVDVFKITNVDVLNNEVTVTSSADVVDGYSCCLDFFRIASSTKVASVKITVANRPFQSVSLSDTQKNLRLDGSFILSAITVPASPTDICDFTWTLSDPSVIEIAKKVSDKEIQLHALKEGSCTVTLKETLHDKSAQCVVTVFPKKTMAQGEQFYFYNTLNKESGTLTGMASDSPQVIQLPGKSVQYYIGLNDHLAITYEDMRDIENQYGTPWSITSGGDVSGESGVAPDSNGIYAYLRVNSGDATMTVKAPNGSSKTISYKSSIKSVSMCTWTSDESDPSWTKNVTTLPVENAAFEVKLPKYASTGSCLYLRFAVNSGTELHISEDSLGYAPFDMFNNFSSDVYAYRTMLGVAPTDLRTSDSWKLMVRNNSVGKTATGIYTFSLEKFGISWTLEVKPAN